MIAPEVPRKRVRAGAIASAILLVICSCGGAAQRPHTTPAQPPAASGTAVALVMSTLSVWIGNEEYEQDPDAVYRGALDPLKRALDKLDIGDRLPAGSRAVVVGYARGARLVHAMSPATELKGSVLGVEKDYQSELGSDFVAGLDLAFDELAKVDAKRKVIVVVGDGTDTNSDTARSRLTEIAARAAKERVEVFVLVVKSPVSGPSNAIDALTPNVKVLESSEDLYPELAAVFPHK